MFRCEKNASIHYWTASLFESLRNPIVLEFSRFPQATTCCSCHFHYNKVFETFSFRGSARPNNQNQISNYFIALFPSHHRNIVESILLHCVFSLSLQRLWLIVIATIESVFYFDCYCEKNAPLCLYSIVRHKVLLWQSSKLAILLMLSAPQTTISTMGVVLIYASQRKEQKSTKKTKKLVSSISFVFIWMDNIRIVCECRAQFWSFWSNELCKVPIDFETFLAYSKFNRTTVA